MAAPAGQGALRRVLLAFSAHAPAVGYCQGMNYLGALALLALGRAEEPAFWLLAAMIDDGGARRRRQAAAARSRRAPRRAALAPTCGAVRDARRAGARAGILYCNTYAHNLVGAHVEMRSLEVRRPPGDLRRPCRALPLGGA